MAKKEEAPIRFIDPMHPDVKRTVAEVHESTGYAVPEIRQLTLDDGTHVIGRFVAEANAYIRVGA